MVIYYLADAASPDVVRYVGQTRDPVGRLKDHASSQGHSNEGPVQRWIGNDKPQLVMGCLEFCTGKDAYEREVYWMVHYRAKGMADLNVMSTSMCACHGVPHFKNHGIYRHVGRRRTA
jgi:hypothetical protein